MSRKAATSYPKKEIPAAAEKAAPISYFNENIATQKKDKKNKKDDSIIINESIEEKGE